MSKYPTYSDSSHSHSYLVPKSTKNTDDTDSVSNILYNKIKDGCTTPDQIRFRCTDNNEFCTINNQRGCNPGQDLIITVIIVDLISHI